jgi:hypothetical protein
MFLRLRKTIIASLETALWVSLKLESAYEFGLNSTPHVWKRKLAHTSHEEFQVGRSIAQKGSKSGGHKLIAPNICKIEIQAREDHAALRKRTIELSKHLNLMCRRSYRVLGGDLLIILMLGSVLTAAFSAVDRSAKFTWVSRASRLRIPAFPRSIENTQEVIVEVGWGVWKAWLSAWSISWLVGRTVYIPSASLCCYDQ